MIVMARNRCVLPLVISFIFPAMYAWGDEIPSPVEILEDAAARLLAIKPDDDGTRDSVNTGLRYLAHVALKKGCLPLGRRAIAAISDEETKGEAQSFICEKYIRELNFARALEECELIPLTNSSVNNYRMFAAQELISAAIQHGHLAEAKRALEFFEPREEVKEYWEFSAADVAIAMAQRGESEWVTKVANSNSAISTRLAIGLALRDEELGYHAEAVNRLVAVKPPLDRPYVMVDLAVGFAKVGDFEGANKVVRQLPDGSDHFFRGWSRVGAVAAQRRDVKKTFEYLTLLSHENGVSWTTNITIELAKAGEVDAAMDAISLFSPKEPVWPAISWTLAPIFQERHDTVGVMACINAAPDGMQRLYQLTHAIGLERHLTVPRGHFSARADRCLLALTSELDRMRGAMSIVDGQLENGERPGAINAAQRALAAYDCILLNGPAEMRMELDRTIRFRLLNCLTRCHLIAEATRLSHEFPEDERHDAQGWVAVATGDVTLIRETILKLPMNERNDAVDTYVNQLCERRESAKAYALVPLAPDPIIRARCLTSIVQAMGEARL